MGADKGTMASGTQILIDGKAVAPRTLYCIGRNFAEHAKELGNAVPAEPVLFLKSGASIRGLRPESLGFADESFHHEIELVLRVGKNLRAGASVPEDLITHVALGLDLTRRKAQTELKAKGLPWTVAKSFAGAAVLGPFLRVSEFGAVGRATDETTWSSFAFRLTVNGDVRQQGKATDMIFSVPRLISWLATFNHFEENDLIFTGTPPGVAAMRTGDRFEMSFVAPRAFEWPGTL